MLTLNYYCTYLQHYQTENVMQKTVLFPVELAELKAIISDCLEDCLTNHQQNSQNTEEVLEVDGVCKMFGVSRTTVYHWRRTGKVNSYQRGRRVFFKKSELLEFRNSEIEGQKKGGKRW